MDKEKGIYYVMGHTIDPTIIPATVEDTDAFVRPTDVNVMGADYATADYYYGYDFVENMKFDMASNSGGSGGSGGNGVTQEQMAQAIQDALNTISLSYDSEDGSGNTVILNVGNRQNKVTLEDNYLADVTTDESGIKFTMSDGQSTFNIPLDDLENDPNIDCETF